MTRAFLSLGLVCGLACRSAPSEPEPLPQPAHVAAAPAEPAPAAPVPAVAAPARAQPEAARYAVPLRSDAELRAEAEGACRKSQQAATPLLLDVGADWCGDCRKLYALEREEPLRSALAGWTTLAVNLGEERHEWLRAAFGIKAIARWLVLLPTDCAAPLETWPVVASRVVEPKTGSDFRGPAELATWLDEVRQKGTAGRAP